MSNPDAWAVDHCRNELFSGVASTVQLAGMTFNIYIQLCCWLVVGQSVLEESVEGIGKQASEIAAGGVKMPTPPPEELDDVCAWVFQRPPPAFVTFN